MKAKIAAVVRKTALVCLLGVPVLAYAQKAYDLPDAVTEGADPMVATTPRIYLERSTVFALGNQFRAFRVPTVDANGAVRYLDVTVTLTPGANGIPAATAAVSSVLSPTVVSNAIVPGIYRYIPTSFNDSCTVTNVALTAGRTQSFFACLDNGIPFEMSVATGSISAGHPFLTELQAASAHTRSDAANYFWGKVTSENTTKTLGVCGFYRGHIIGVKQVSNQIIVYEFGTNAAAVDCSVALTRQ